MKTKPDKQIWRLIKPYADKIRRHRCWLYTMRGICVGIILAVILNIVAFLIPINYIVVWSLGLIVLSGLLGYLFSIVFKEKTSQIVRKIDEFGLDERVQTMWELSDVETDFALLQRQDTIQQLQDQKINLKKQAFSFPKQYRWVCGVGLLIIILCLIIPNPQRDVLAKRRADQVTLQEQAQLVEDMRAQLNQDNSMDQAVKQELNIELQKLAEKLRKEKDLSEGIKQLSQTQKKIEELRKETRTENQQLSDALKERDETRSLGNYLQDGNNEALRQWEKQAADQAEAKQTADALRQAAENTDNQEAKEKLEEMAEALEAGENEKAEALANQLKETMNSGSVDNDSNTSNATFGQLGDQLNIAKGRMTQSNKKTSDAEGRSQQGKSNQSNGEVGQNSKPASSSGQSKGNKEGQGSGQGNGSGEGGQKGQGPASNKSGGKGAGNGSGALKDFEKVYDATRLGGEGQIDQIEGQIDENGESMQGAVEGMGNFDGYIPYDEVVGEYGEEAVQGAQRENLPPAAQDWVQGYFEALQ